MKNILIVFTVLAVTSTASATMTLVVDNAPHPGSVDVPVGSTLDIGISNDDPEQKGLAFFIHVDPTDLSLGAIDDITAAWNNVNPGPPPIILDMGDLDPAFKGIIQVDLSKPDPFFVIPVGQQAGGMIFTCYDLGDVTLRLMDSPIAAAGTVLDTLTVHQIPEPMTFALLGLGGLFLRRRK